MQVLCQELPPIGTNAYLVADPERGRAVVIDAPAEAYGWATAAAAEAGCVLEALVLTHGHWDHTLDAHRFAGAGVPVYGNAADRLLFEEPELMAAFAIPGLEMVAVTVDHWIGEGDRVELAGRTAEVRAVPGHCPGSVLLYFSAEGIAFVGDAIFAGGVGRYDLPGGDFPTLERSIRERIYTLPDATRLYPGHGPATRVDAEKAGNPFVRP